MRVIPEVCVPPPPRMFIHAARSSAAHLVPNHRTDRHALWGLMDTQQESTVMQQLEKFWAGVRADGFWECPVAHVREHIREVVTVARRDHMQPERLLPSVKESWRSLPELRQATDPERVTRLHDTIIRICIEE